MKVPWRSILQVVAAVGLTILGALFFKGNAGEMKNVWAALRSGEPFYLGIALLGMLITLYGQSKAIQLAYASLNHHITLSKAASLYLKRFFLSPFIPGGFSVAQYTLSRDLDPEIPKVDHAFASTTFVIAGIAAHTISFILIVLLLARFIFPESHTLTVILIVAMGIGGILACLIFLFRTRLTHQLRKKLTAHVGNVESAPILNSVIYTVVVEAAGILTFWAALHALHIDASPAVAAGAYLLSILIVTVSPLFQGLVVVEGALVIFLDQFGIDKGQALAGALIFRGFQLWIPLIMGAVVYVVPLLNRAKKHLIQ